MRGHGHSPLGWALLVALVVVYQHTLIKLALLAVCASAAIALILSGAVGLATTG